MKRLFDILVSLSALILLSLFMLIVAVLISIAGKGSPFYMQTRVGKDGRHFKLLKFRTMRTGSDKLGHLTVGARDPRITGLGYYLRRFKLDELPQLINVLKGDMSIVGPRPEVPEYVALYSPDQRRVLELRPGLTDLASIEYISENEILAMSEDPEKTYINEVMPHKLELALKYAEKHNLLTDFAIIFRTLRKIFS